MAGVDVTQQRTVWLGASMGGFVQYRDESKREKMADKLARSHITGFFFQAEDGIRDYKVTGVQTCALPICALRPPWQLPDAIAPALHRSLRADAARTRRLEHAWRESGTLRAQDLWPNLRVISCWTEASSRPAVPALRELFPGVHIQIGRAHV